MEVGGRGGGGRGEGRLSGGVFEGFGDLNRLNGEGRRRRWWVVDR